MAKQSFIVFISCLLASHLFASQSKSLENCPSRLIPPSPNKVLNTIDWCWRMDPNWENNRKDLANCAKGFGSGAMGGQNGPIYTVSNPSDDPLNPKPGTIRHALVQTEPLWIIFEKDMVITLEKDLMVTSDKTIDGRGVKIEIANGPCLTLRNISHVIIHGISIHDCKPDAITIYGSSSIWIDHCYLARCFDGLIDITHASTDITISNNFFTQHDKVMLLGHSDSFTKDKIMKVTVAFNYFGPCLVERMPRVRYGYAHVANNMYDQWQYYAIGGSADPTILSEGNYFHASDEHKKITKREGGVRSDIWRSWTWKSSPKDKLFNHAVFEETGYGNADPGYSYVQDFPVADGLMVPCLIADAGPLNCMADRPCS